MNHRHHPNIPTIPLLNVISRTNQRKTPVNAYEAGKFRALQRCGGDWFDYIRHMIKRLVLVLITAFLLPACSHNPTTATANSSDHKTITRQQIADNHFHTAYEAVAALHSNWLQTRGTDSFQRPSEVLVIMNSNELGGVETLRNINAETVSFIRWYDGMEATSRWGVGHSAGVIFVSSHEE